MGPEPGVGLLMLRRCFLTGDEQGVDEEEAWSAACGNKQATSNNQESSFVLNQNLQPQNTVTFTELN